GSAPPAWGRGCGRGAGGAGAAAGSRASAAATWIEPPQPGHLPDLPAQESFTVSVRLQLGQVTRIMARPPDRPAGARPRKNGGAHGRASPRSRAPIASRSSYFCRQVVYMKPTTFGAPRAAAAHVS